MTHVILRSQEMIMTMTVVCALSVNDIFDEIISIVRDENTQSAITLMKIQNPHLFALRDASSVAVIAPTVSSMHPNAG